MFERFADCGSDVGDHLAPLVVDAASVGGPRGDGVDGSSVDGSSVDRCFAALRACVAEVAAEARSAATWSSSDRVAALAALDATAAAVAEARAHVLVADRASGESVLPGDRSYEAARARMTRSGVGEARRALQQADVLVSMPTVAAGVRDGSVPLGHLDVLARAAAGAPAEVAAVLRSAQVQADVVGLARAHSAPEFARAVARFVAAQDPAGLEAAHQDQYEARFLAVSAQPHGVFVKGRLDVTAGQSLLIALDAMNQLPDETRTPAQASADALVMLAERVCAGTSATDGVAFRSHRPARPGRPDDTGVDVCVPDGARPDLPDGAGVGVLSGTASRPHLSLLVPAATFAEVLAHEHARQARDDEGSRSRSRSSGGAGGRADRQPVAPAWSTVAPATLEDGTPVAMSELARCLCDADVTRIVLAADGQPLDVGRTKRLHTAAQRKAVIVRDRQCAWNGCQTAPARCEVHHLRWWHRDSGPTSVDEATLLCRHHHGETHRHDLAIERLSHEAGTPDGTPMRYVFRNPDGAVMNAPPGWTELRVCTPGPRSEPEAGSRSGSGGRRDDAREPVAFDLFNSAGPPPEWATG